ncbi:hypothetical protein B0H11DRAFT_1685146, partial [Mycena galericulata]
IVDLYMVGSPEHEAPSVPFEHWMSLGGPKGEKVRALGLFDTGAQVAAIDTKFYLSKERRLGKASAPTKRLRMADGKVVSTYGRWEGEAEIEGVRIRGAFEIFDSGGGWKILFGKPLQAKMGAVHDVAADIVTLHVGERTATLANQNPSVWRGGIQAAFDAARRKASMGASSCETPPARRV